MTMQFAARIATAPILALVVAGEKAGIALAKRDERKAYANARKVTA